MTGVHLVIQIPVFPHLARLDEADFLGNHLKKTRRKNTSSRAKLANGLKVAPLYGSVGDIWAEHQDALDPRKVLNRLKDNRKFPWKTLAFDQQVRPPYSGKLPVFPS